MALENSGMNVFSPMVQRQCR